MTLHSKLLVKGVVPAEKLFKFCQTLLGDPEQMVHGHREAGVEVTATGYEIKRPNHEFYNQLGQGLAAILEVEYGADGPLINAYACQGEEDHCEEDHNDPESYCAREIEAYKGAYLKVDLDTAYGYQAENGAGCSDLHAWIFTEVVMWLLDQGVTDYLWYQEFSGEWYDSILDIHVLGDPEKGKRPLNTHPKKETMK